MVEIKPFRATILNPEVNNREELICPVYDTIDTAQYRRYSIRRNNVIHFTTRHLGMREGEFVNHARTTIERMFRECILVERASPALYIYGITYRLPDELMEMIPECKRQASYFASGLVALVRVEKLNEHLIFGHERTFESNTAERYLLMKECGMNFAPIVAAYKMPEMPDPDASYSSMDKKPLVDLSLDGTRHQLWELTDERVIMELQQLMRDRKILILDGHHRYTASYWLSRHGGPGYTMMMLLEEGDRGLLLLPWHRCLKLGDDHMKLLWERIKSHFHIESCTREDIYSKLHDASGDFDVRVGMYDREDFYMLYADERGIRALSEYRGERVGLDVISLHEWLIDPMLRPSLNGGGVHGEALLFTASPREAIEKVDNGTFRVAFFLKPPRMADVEYKAMVERRGLPQKSTLFLPKVAEGVVMRKFHRDEEEQGQEQE